jgi:hypothetical protein
MFGINQSPLSRSKDILDPMTGLGVGTESGSEDVLGSFISAAAAGNQQQVGADLGEELMGAPKQDKGGGFGDILKLVMGAMGG